MTGVAAIFELYTEYKQSKKDLKKEAEEPKLEPDPEESVEGYIDEESEWHRIIQSKHWGSLLFVLQTYDFALYKPKEPDKKKEQRLRVVGAAMWVKSKVVRPRPPEETPPSPLLALNEQGETPLHVAVKNLAPDKYIIRMVFCEKRAALVADDEGRLPLHLSCIHERTTEVIDRLIRANFHHMQREDTEGNTALWYAVRKAKERREREGDTKCFWGIPRTKEEAEWQEQQETVWSKVRFILLSYSTRRKIFVEAERDVLLEVLEHAAPPTVLEVTILAGQGMLHSDPTLASSALRLFMKREYQIKNLQLLLHHFPDKNVESLEAARKILTEHYYLGCRKLPGRDLTFREEMEKHALEDNYKRSLVCQEWWNKIQCLLRLCGHQNCKEDKKKFEKKYLLHAALSNSDTPPSLVQLLMVMAPEAIRLPHPFNHSMLIHLICRNWKYNLYPHSKRIGVQIELEEPPMEQVLKIILSSDPTLTRKRHRNRLPLHDAVVTSKSAEFLEALVQKDRKSLSVRDAETKLYPCQMAALGGVNKNAGLWAHAKYSPEEWKSLEPQERAGAVEDVIAEQDVEQVNAIYYLLRQFPAVVTSGQVTTRKAHGFRDTHGKGMVSAHYLLLLYARGENDEYMLMKENLATVQKAINTGSIPEELEQWWAKLKFWVRYCYSGNQNLPNGEEYLLHAAVANSDVPPLVVDLILAMYPESSSLPIHGETEFPLHIAAATQPYQPQAFEMIESKNVWEMLLDAHTEAASIQSPSGTPLDIALAYGTRSEEELKPLMDDAVGGMIKEMSLEMEEDIYFSDGGATPAPGLEDSSVGNSEFSDEDNVHEDESAIEDIWEVRSHAAVAPAPSAEKEKEGIPEEEPNEETVLRLQSFVRGSIARGRVSDMVGEMIAQMEAEFENAGNEWESMA